MKCLKSTKFYISLAIDWKVVFFNSKNILLLLTTPLKCLEKVATGHFVNLPITYKSQKSNFKI